MSSSVSGLKPVLLTTGSGVQSGVDQSRPTFLVVESRTVRHCSGRAVTAGCVDRSLSSLSSLSSGASHPRRAEPPQEDWTLWNNLYQRCLYNCGFDGCSRLGYKDVTYVTGGCVEGCRNGGRRTAAPRPTLTSA